MAKKIIQPKSMEEALWEACNKLRGSIESSEYKHVVLSLIFLKYAGDHFEKRRQEIVAEGHEAFADNVAFYAAKNVFYLAPESRWDFIMENAKQPDIALKNRQGVVGSGEAEQAAQGHAAQQLLRQSRPRHIQIGFTFR